MVGLWLAVKTLIASHSSRYMFVISALRSWRQNDYKFEVSLSDIVRPYLNNNKKKV
jgi:uncharacterized protein YggT (Ycf19 family)